MHPDVAIIVVQNEKGLLYVHQRSASKKRFPSLYGLGAGGRLEPGESPTQAAQRELSEELGSTEKVQFLFSFDYQDTDARYTVHAFKVTHNDVLLPCAVEFQWSGWLTKKDIDKLLHENKLCPDTAIVYQKYFK